MFHLEKTRHHIIVNPISRVLSLTGTASLTFHLPGKMMLFLLCYFVLPMYWNALCSYDTVVVRWSVWWPFWKNMLLFTSKHSLPSPYGCNPLWVSNKWQLIVSNSSGLLLIFALSKWNPFFWNHAFSTRFGNIFLTPACNLWWAYVKLYTARAHTWKMKIKTLPYLSPLTETAFVL